MQVPAQAELQQTPCWQNPEAHCAAVVQAAPGFSSPQTPALQTLGDTQSVLVAQEVSQIVALPQIRFPGQAPATTGLQIPEPSQVCAGVSVEPAQLPGTHWVPATYVRQAPAPLQVPSVPQVEVDVVAHWEVGVGAWPVATGEQVPGLPLSAHDMQVPVQAELQQTPCAQNPEAHALARVQAAPGGSLPQLMVVVLQVLGETQSVFEAQVVLQAPVPHSNGSHMAVVAARQVPAPSQVRPDVSVEPVQDAEPQAVPAG
jgi:hypothetical protein